MLTVSDKGSAGERVDTAGPAVADIIERLDAQVVERAIVPDVREEISSRLRSWADELHLDVIVTTGGTGMGPRDVTPEATLDVAERHAPGIAEAMRQVGRESTPLASLSRSVVVLRGKTLIINLPGSVRGATESLEAILELIPHVTQMLSGDTEHKDPGTSGTEVPGS